MTDRGGRGDRLLIVAALLVTACAGRPASSAREPRLVEPESVSSTMAHESPSGFDPVTGELYFTRAAPDWSASRIYRASPDGIAPAPFSDGPYDAGVSFAADGSEVWFTSSRPTGSASAPDAWNLWRSGPGGEGAVALPPPVNSPAAECCAVWSPDGSVLFASDRAGSWDIYRARRETGDRWVVTLVGEPVTTREHDEWPSFVGNAGRLLLFSSIRPGGTGGDDVFVACAASLDDGWTAHRLGAPVNTEAYEDSAVLSPDSRVLLFSSRRPRPGGSGLADVYEIDRDAVAWPPACRPG